MHASNTSQDVLAKHKLRKTAFRMEVLQLFLQAENKALSNKDIEMALGDMDRVTLYRTLKTFEEKGLIHQAFDGSGVAKYALCTENCTQEEHHHEHAHFHCTNCQETLCLNTEIKFSLNTPKGFRMDQTHIIVEGLCETCNQ